MINRNRQATFARKAELLSGVGAVVLGGGIALMWPDVLFPFATQLLIVGIALQGFAECFLSPRYLEFASKQAPPGQEGLYMGYSHINFFFAWFVCSTA